MADDKPLHVRVAEVVEGHEYYLSPYVVINGERRDVPTWFYRADWCSPDNPPAGWYAGSSPVRYDTDWAATGPLIERLKAHLFYDEEEELAERWCVLPREDDDDVDRFYSGPTPLLAVCALILALAEAGKLPRG
jgi:hypothetical protein